MLPLEYPDKQVFSQSRKETKDDRLLVIGLVSPGLLPTSGD